MLEFNYISVKLVLHLISFGVEKLTCNRNHESTKLTQSLVLESKK